MAQTIAQRKVLRAHKEKRLTPPRLTIRRNAPVANRQISDGPTGAIPYKNCTPYTAPPDRETFSGPVLWLVGFAILCLLVALL